MQAHFDQCVVQLSPLVRFSHVGLYYFQTATNDGDEHDTCIVHVRERQREFKVDVRDDDFAPPILVITQGDRVWWEWKKDKVRRSLRLSLCFSFKSDHLSVLSAGFEGSLYIPDPSTTARLSEGRILQTDAQRVQVASPDVSVLFHALIAYDHRDVGVSGGVG